MPATDHLLFLLSFLRDGVAKLHPHEPHIICMPDFVVTLWWENQYLPIGTTQLPMLFLCKSVGTTDFFNSPSCSASLSNSLFKAILPLKWGKAGCIGTSEHSEYPGGLHCSSGAGHSIWELCTPTLHSLCCPVELHEATHPCTAMSHWENTLGTQQGQLTQPFRSTVCYCWPQRREGTESDALQNTCLRTAVGGRHGWMVLVGLCFRWVFF